MLFSFLRLSCYVTGVHFVLLILSNILILLSCTHLLHFSFPVFLMVSAMVVRSVTFLEREPFISDFLSFVTGGLFFSMMVMGLG